MAESGAPEQQREDSTEQGHAPWDAQTHQVSAALAGPAAPPPMAWPAHSVQRSLGWLSHWRGLPAGTCSPLVLVPTVLGFSGRGTGAARPLCSAQGSQVTEDLQEALDRPCVLGCGGCGPLGVSRATPSFPVEASWELGLGDPSDPVTLRPLGAGNVRSGVPLTLNGKVSAQPWVPLEDPRVGAEPPGGRGKRDLKGVTWGGSSPHLPTCLPEKLSTLSYHLHPLGCLLSSPPLVPPACIPARLSRPPPWLPQLPLAPKGGVSTPRGRKGQQRWMGRGGPRPPSDRNKVCSPGLGSQQGQGGGDTARRVRRNEGPGWAGRLTFSARTSIWLLEVVTMMSSGEKSLTSTANS